MLTMEEQKKLKSLIVHEEAKRNFIYRDSMGNETVGIGHLCANGFSDAVIDLIYEEDKDKIYNYLLKAFVWFGPMDVNRKMAIISMAFNLGIPRFLKFKDTINFLANKQYQQAANAMRLSLWAKQVPNRVKELCAIIETGELPKGI